jgi:hypothetical protein
MVKPSAAIGTSSPKAIQARAAVPAARNTSQTTSPAAASAAWPRISAGGKRLAPGVRAPPWRAQVISR